MEMFERLKAKLEKADAAGWELTETSVKSREYYLIRHRLDQNRAVETVSYDVKLYKDIENGAFLGSASGSVSPTATDEEIDRIIADTLLAAGYVKNPPYKLTEEKLPQPAQESADLSAISEAFLKAVRAAKETEDVNSYEIFVKEIRRRYENSNGVTYRCTFPSSMAEVVVNARKGGREIELYRNFTSGTCDAEKLTKDVEAAMAVGRDRLEAVPTPKALAGLDVVFSDRYAVPLYDYFLHRMSAGFKVRRLSDWEIGTPVCKDARGDAVTLEAVASLPNSSRSLFADDEGSLIFDRVLIRAGVPENFWGSRQMSQYLGLAKSSLVYNTVVSGGTHTEEELRRGDYLEVREFSDLQVDPVGGDIAGEIRLAYWHHDGICTPVTGGSLSGQMAEALKEMRFTPETVRYDTSVVPAVTRISGLKITGVE